MTKNALRRTILAQRAALSPSAQQEKSNAIHAQLFESDAFHGATCVFTYISIHSEVDTAAILQAAWQQGKQVAVPVTAAEGQMHFSPISPSTPLVRTKFGTLEPTFSSSSAIVPAAADLFLVPGAVFDRQGNRYGYGGGFYDRYLAAHPTAKPIALAFSLQIQTEPLHTQPHDLPMHAILSETGWIIPTQHGN